MQYKQKYRFGILLFLLSIMILVVIAPVAFAYSIIKPVFMIVSRLLYMIAFSIDQLGNVLCAVLFNDLLIQRNGFKFGNPDHTISAVLGVNQRTKTLKLTGELLVWILDFIDPNHCEKAAIQEGLLKK